MNKGHTRRNHKIGKWNKGATKVGITKCECYKQNRPMFYVNLVHGSMRKKVRNILDENNGKKVKFKNQRQKV